MSDNAQDGLLPEADATITVRQLLQDSANDRRRWRRWLPPGLCSVGLHFFFLPFMAIVTVTFSDQILSVATWDTAEQRETVGDDSIGEVDIMERDLPPGEEERIVLVPSVLIEESAPPPMSATTDPVDGQPVESVLFEPHVLPILKTKCFKCHGDGPKFAGKLDMRTLASLMTGGGDEGPGVTPGSTAKSSIWSEIAERQMPPKGEPQLTEAEKQLVEKWIKTGAKSNTAATAQSAPPAPAGTAGATGNLSPEEAQLLQLVNKHRNAKGKPPLQVSLRLFQVARAYAALLAQQGQLDDELDGWDTVKRVKTAGYQFKIVGSDEKVTANICGGNNFSPLTAFNLWTASAAAETNLLDYEEAGIGIANNKNGEVFYYMILATPAK